jgi:hypothetical protein
MRATAATTTAVWMVSPVRIEILRARAVRCERHDVRNDQSQSACSVKAKRHGVSLEWVRSAVDL